VALVIGAGSGIGRAFAGALAGAGYRLILAGRDAEELARVASDCHLRHGIEARVVRFDALLWSTHADFFGACENAFEEPPRAIALCHGEMADESLARRDSEVSRRMLTLNYVSAVPILEWAAGLLPEHAGGWICGVTSVAGDRGRRSNHLYGSSKAAISTYLQGLRARLATRGVVVTDVRPGFVDTSLTWGLPGLFAVASPERVARDALRGLRGNRPVVYSPGFWRLVMALIRAIPDRIFNRLPL
jgi:short-subunit dehydrogenase